MIHLSHMYIPILQMCLDVVIDKTLLLNSEEIFWSLCIFSFNRQLKSKMLLWRVHNFSYAYISKDEHPLDYTIIKVSLCERKFSHSEMNFWILLQNPLPPLKEQINCSGIFRSKKAEQIGESSEKCNAMIK